jgi:hypothetical protein
LRWCACRHSSLRPWPGGTSAQKRRNSRPQASPIRIPGGGMAPGGMEPGGGPTGGGAPGGPLIAPGGGGPPGGGGGYSAPGGGGGGGGAASGPNGGGREKPDVQDDTTPAVMPTNATVSNVSHGFFIGRAPPLKESVSPQNDSILTFFRRQNRGKTLLSPLVLAAAGASQAPSRRAACGRQGPLFDLRRRR